VKPLRAASAALLALVPLAGTACIVTPVVHRAGRPELRLDHLPAGAEAIEVRSDDGTKLRGVFVPAAPVAPADGPAAVVLHLLPSSTSITSGVGRRGGLAGMRGMLETLASAGFASLVVDYRGVGASEGERTPRKLHEDARAMWVECLRRADGRADRVIVRAASIGTLAAAALLEAGARPAGVVMFAPIRAETIGRHGARRRKGAFLGALISPFLRRPLDVDLLEVVERLSVPGLIFVPADDHYLPEAEVALLARAAADSATEIVTHGDRHHALVLRAFGVALEERSYRGELAPELLSEERGYLETLGL